MFAGDKLAGLKPERMRLLQQALPVCDVRPLDLYPFFGLLPGQKTIHRVHAVSGIALCGRRRESIRDKWQEFGAVPLGQRLCTECRKETDL